MQVALCGMIQSGKSSLFTAVTEGHEHAGAAAAHQVDKAVVKVPDERLDVLTEMYKPKKTTQATIEFLDLPGLSFVDEGHRNDARKIVAQARQSDMLVVVVCDFHNPSVMQYRDRIDPAADLEELRTELFLADLEMVVNRIDRLEKSKNKPTKTQQQDKQELEMMKRYSAALEELQPLSGLIESPEEEKMVRSFGFLTMKPMLVVLNVNDDRVTEPPTISEQEAGTDVMVLSTEIEAEIASLDPEERGAFLEDLGLTESAKDRLVKMCYKEMNLISFLTTGEDEVRAWSVPAGCPAVEAAGAIHSDIQRGFIRAETVAYDDLIECGDMKAAKAAGKVRLEGKTYEVRDGDIINFRFNV